MVEKLIHLKYGVGGELYRYPAAQPPTQTNTHIYYQRFITLEPCPLKVSSTFQSL